MRVRDLIAGILVPTAACLAIACAMPGRAPRELRSPLEQLLLSQAIERSAENTTLGLPEGTRVVLDSSGLSNDHGFVADVVEGWLGRQGIVILEKGDGEEARYRVRMIVQAVGNDQDIKFFGILASRLLWVPIVLPEMAFWKKNRQAGYARIYFDIFDIADGRYVRSTPPFEGEFHQTRYTALLFFKWRRGDERSPPADYELIDDELTEENEEL